MKKTFAVLLAAAVAVACGGKKASTTPAGKPMETNPTGGDPYGGDAYGGRGRGHGKAVPPAGKDTPNPCAPK